MILERLIREALEYLNYAGLNLSEAEETGDPPWLDEAYDYVVLAIDALNAWLERNR